MPVLMELSSAALDLGGWTWVLVKGISTIPDTACHWWIKSMSTSTWNVQPRAAGDGTRERSGGKTLHRSRAYSGNRAGDKLQPMSKGFM